MFIIGHRGAKGMEPENTLMAMRAGMTCADYVEIDTRLTRDRVPVIMHDPTVDRTTSGAGPVNGYNLEEIRILDAGKGEPIPTLEEVCNLVKGRCGLFVEIKEPGSEPLVCSILGQNQPENLYIVSFHPESIISVQDLLPGVKTGIIYSRGLTGLPLAAERIGADAILIKFALLNRDLVKECHEKNLLIISWTLDSQEEFRMAHELGIDGLATDYPCRARNYVAEQVK